MEKEFIATIEEFFTEIIDAEKASELFETRSREGIFSPALVMWCTICARLQGRKTLEGALETILEGNAELVMERNAKSERVLFGKISQNNGGLCRARQRVSLAAIERVCTVIAEELIKRQQRELWHGRRAFLMDGTTITLAQSKSNQNKYRAHDNLCRKSHTSQMVCTCIHDLFTGVGLSPAVGPYAGEEAIGETRLGKDMLKRLKTRGIIIADRAFGIFAIAYTAVTGGHEVFVRLNRQRAQAILKRKLGAQDIDEEVLWQAGVLKNHPEIPKDATVKGRLVQTTIYRDGYRPLPLIFFTTLKESVEELCTLYLQRERIENDIRSLKYVLGLEMINSKTPEVVEKEVLLGITANNLVRAIVAEVAEKIGVSARKISFSRAVALIRIFGHKIRDAGNQAEHEYVIERFVTAIKQSKLPTRKKRRMEPRKIVRRRNTFPLMKNSREQERLDSLKIAQKAGHRGFFSTVSRKS